MKILQTERRTRGSAFSFLPVGLWEAPKLVYWGDNTVPSNFYLQGWCVWEVQATPETTRTPGFGWNPPEGSWERWGGRLENV
jgi:hypothetical protein